MSDKKFELSRRRALIGLGAVGAASAGAGLGTSAYFSDEEAFDGNTIQAGEFGLTVEQQVHGINQDGTGPDEENFDGAVGDDGVWIQDSITIEDAKPGDEYEFCWDITVEENPGYVALAACYDDWTGVEAGNVELGDLWDIDDESDLSTIGAETLVDDVSLKSGGSASYSYDTVGDLLADLQTGALLDDDGTPVEFGPGKTWTLCIDLSIPTEVGNELQGALLEWDLAFYAEQARHNDGGGVAARAANSIVCEREPEGQPECTECDTPQGTEDFLTIENINSNGFPTVQATARVDTTAGGNGDLDDPSLWGVCEETVDGLGEGFCGQTIESVTFGGEQEETFADVMIVMDTSGSMEFEPGKFQSAKNGAYTLIGGDADITNDANAGGFDPTVNVGLVRFASSASTPAPLGTDQNTVEDEIDALNAVGGTSLNAGISNANDEFFADTSVSPPTRGPNNREGVPDFMIVLGNGDTSGGKAPADFAKNNGVTIFGIAYGSGADVEDFEDISGQVPSDPDYEDFTFKAGTDDITDIFSLIGEQIFGTYTIEYDSANFATDGNDRNVRLYVDDAAEGDADDIGSYTAPSS